MIKGLKIFDCTLREVGYQTGWHFDVTFARNVYKFAQTHGIDYVEIGFFNNEEAEPGRGDMRYCSLHNDQIKDVFVSVKKNTKLSAMRNIQRPLSPLLPKNESVIDTIRILTQSSKTKLDILEQHVDEAMELGYEVFINYTSAGYNTMEQNKEFAKFAAGKGVCAIEFADTESIMTPDYVRETIHICKEAGIDCGIHLHDKKGRADELADLALSLHVAYMDVTHLGLGGKWRDGNLTMEFLLRRLSQNLGYEATAIKNELIDQLIKYHDFSAAE